jgi:hypothetical protein
MFVEQMLLRAHERLATVDAGAPVIEAAGLMSKPRTNREMQRQRLYCQGRNHHDA